MTDSSNSKRPDRRKWYIRVSLISFAVLILLGFLVTLRGVPVRKLHWAGIGARNEGGLFSEPDSIKVFAQIYCRPNLAARPITIRLPDGTSIRSDEITQNTLRQRLGAALKTMRYSEDKPILSVRYELGKLAVYFENEEVTLIIIDAWWARTRTKVDRSAQSVPAIGPADGTPEYSLPITEGDLHNLFGEPENEETYRFAT